MSHNKKKPQVKRICENVFNCEYLVTSCKRGYLCTDKNRSKLKGGRYNDFQCIKRTSPIIIQPTHKLITEQELMNNLRSQRCREKSI